MMNLADTLTDQRSVFFLGAGACRDCGLPLGDEGAVAILQSGFGIIGKHELWLHLNSKYQNGEPEWPRFEVVLEQFAQYIPTSLVDITRCFQDIGLASTPQLLAEACMHPHIWLTTNFDNQVELSLERRGQPYRVVSDRASIAKLVQEDLSTHLVVKLHGDPSTVEPELNLGVKVDQILRAFPEQARKSLVHLTMGRPLLFVGYAARDPDLFQLVSDLIHGSDTSTWIGLGEPSVGVKTLMGQHSNVRYLDGGTPHDLAAALKIASPTAEFLAKAWSEKVSAWLSQSPRENLTQSLASICLEQNSPDSRKAVWTLHALISDIDSQQVLWKIDRESELLLRSPVPRKAWSDKYQSRLKAIYSDTEMTAPAVSAYARLSSANLFWKTADTRQAEEQLDEIIGANEGVDAQLRIRALTRLGMVQVYQGSDSFEQGLENIETAITLAQENDSSVLRLEAVQNMAVGLMRLDQAERAESLLLEIEPLVKEIGNPRRTLVWMLQLAEANRYQRRFAKAAEINELIMERAKLYEDDEAAMNCGNNLGLCYLNLGRVREAERAYRDSLASSTRRGGEAVHNTQYNLGWLRMLLMQFEDSIPYFVEAEEGFRTFGSPEREGAALALNSWCQFRLGHVAESARLLSEIRKRGVIPKGVLKSEYKLVDFVHSLPSYEPKVVLPLIGSWFQEEPEQEYYIASWLLDSVSLKDEARFIGEVVQRAYEAANRSAMPLNFSTLGHILDRRNVDVLDEFLRQIESRSAGPLSKLTSSL